MGDALHDFQGGLFRMGCAVAIGIVTLAGVAAIAAYVWHVYVLLTMNPQH